MSVVTDGGLFGEERVDALVPAVLAPVLGRVDAEQAHGDGVDLPRHGDLQGVAVDPSDNGLSPLGRRGRRSR